MQHMYKFSSKHSKMSMRLYHRRASTSRDRLQIPNGNSLNGSLGTFGHRESLGANRPRSQSLFPGCDTSLVVPSRSRSSSFSDASRVPEYLTAYEEENIFRCYTRVMYIILGGMAAAAMGLFLYGVHTFAKFR